MKSSKTSAYIHQTTRCHNLKYGSLNFIHTCFRGINSSNDSRTNRNNSGRTIEVPKSWNTLYKFWDVTNKSPLRVNQGPCHFFRPNSISSRRIITKLLQYSTNHYSKTAEIAKHGPAASHTAITTDAIQLMSSGLGSVSQLMTNPL